MKAKAQITSRIQDFQGLFPAYSEGIYLNHAAISPFCRLTKEIFDEYWARRAHMPVDVYHQLLGEKEEFVTGIARLIHAEGGDDISLVPNTSTGLNLVAQGLNIQPGDEILLPSVEFPANVYPFMNLEETGARIIWVHPREGRISPEMIMQKATPRTRLVSVSFVQYLNGFRMDLAAVGRRCREMGIVFCVDGIQGIGAVPLDVQDCCIDVLACGGHKWLMWPMGTGFLYTSPALRPKLQVPVVGWLSVEDPWALSDFRLILKKGGERFEPGTQNFMGMAIARRMLQHFLVIGIESIWQRIFQLTERLILGLKDLGMSVVSPPDPEERSGIVSVRCPDAHFLETRLKEEGVIAAHREGMLRFSPHFTNRDEDIEKLLRVLKGTLA